VQEQIVSDPFYIDSGELKRITPEDAFVLGVEWATLRLLIDADPHSPLNIDIHHENAERVSALCHSRGRIMQSEPVDSIWLSISILPVSKRNLRLVSG
jgi:hypothetical protein